MNLPDLFLSRLLAASALALSVPCSAAASVQTDLPANAPFRDEIKRFEELDLIQTPPHCPVLFVGSSSIRLWKTLRADMAPLPVVNRGFGGSTIAQANLYFDRLVTPYRPRAIVVYAGENDVDMGTPPADAAAAFQRFMTLKSERLGSTPVFYISVKPSKARIAQFARQAEVNRSIRDMAVKRSDLHFIDVVPAMLSGGVPKDIYVEDGLHMAPAGYALWREAVASALRKAKIDRRSCR